MADNVTADPGSGGATFKTDEDTGASAHVPVTKIELGAANSFDGFVSDSNPMPVDDAGGSITVDNGGTFATQEDGAALTSLQLIDDSIFADDAAFTLTSSKTTVAGAIRDDALTTLTAVEADVVPLRTDSTGALWVAATDGGGSITVDGTVDLGTTDSNYLANISSNSSTLAGAVSGAEVQVDIVASAVISVDTEMPSAAALADNAANPTAPAVGSFGMVWDGATWDRMPGTSADGVTVNLGSNNDVTVTGTVDLGATDNAVLDSIASNTASGAVVGGGTEATALRVTLASDSTGVLSIDDNGGSITIDGSVTADLGANNDVTVTGGNAHDGTTLGNPVLGGARATNSIEGITQVANADLTLLQADLNGVLISRPHTTLEEIISERVSNTSGTSTAFTNFAAGGAGIHNYVTTISIYNSSATDGYVDFRDGTAGSVIFTAAAPAAGGSVINLPVPLKGAANTALAYDVSGALSTVYISVVGFQAQG